MQRVEVPEVTVSEAMPSIFSPARIDALKEVASIGAGHAATALSLMTGARIMIEVPMVTVGQLDELAPAIAEPDAPIVSVMMEMNGSLTGQTLLALPMVTGRRLADLMLRRERRSGSTAFDSLEESALKEAGNILGGAYMTALSDFLGMHLMPSPPRFRVGIAQQILDGCNASVGRGVAVCCVETEFSFEEVGERFRGFFLLLPDTKSFSAIFRAVRVS